MEYIPADKLIAEIEFAKSVYDNPKRVIHGVADAFRQDGRAAMCDDILKKIASLQQEPRFPQYDNIVEKVFGAGNLEGWERDEAEMLVALAKEELLKSLQQEQQEEMDEDFFFDEILKVYDCNNKYLPRSEEELTMLVIIARHFYELGLAARRGE